MSSQYTPCCYYPASVLLVDDDETFIQSLAELIDYAKPICYCDAHKANAALPTLMQPDFVSRILDTLEEDLEDHNVHLVHGIAEQSSNVKRLDDISVAILDYQMPGINGLSIAETLRQKMPNTKIILLTAEADSSVAINAFNDNKIDKFIRKDEANLVDIINQSIIEMQWQYFAQLSAQLYSNFLSNSIHQLPHCIQREAFNDFMQAQIKQHELSEFYLQDLAGLFLTVDNAQQPAWLLARTQAEQAEDYELAQEYFEETQTDNAQTQLKLLKEQTHLFGLLENSSQTVHSATALGADLLYATGTSR